MNWRVDCDVFCSYRIAFLEEGEEIGHGYLYVIRNDLHNTPYGLMEDVFVKEEFRGKGYGEQIVRKIIGMARKQGYYKLVGTSRVSRKRVHEFYEKLGFKEHGKEFRMNLF